MINKKINLTILTALSEFSEDLIETFDSIKSDLAAEKLLWVIKSKSILNENDLLPFKGFEKSIKIIAQKDNSIYEGLNKGLDSVDTDYFLVLGAGDTLVQGAIDLINQEIREKDPDGLFFSVNYPDFIIYPLMKTIDFRMPASHQGTILKTKNVLSLNKFNDHYKLAADYDLTCRYLNKFKKINVSPIVISNYKGNGFSAKNNFEAALELYVIAHKFWKENYKQLEYNDLIIKNLTKTNERLKLKKEKENMETPIDFENFKKELFNHVLILSKNQKEENEVLKKEIDKIFKALNLAYQDFSSLRDEIKSVRLLCNNSREQGKIENSTKDEKPVPSEQTQWPISSRPPMLENAPTFEEKIKPLSSQEKLKILFGE